MTINSGSVSTPSPFFPLFPLFRPSLLIPISASVHPLPCRSVLPRSACRLISELPHTTHPATPLIPPFFPLFPLFRPSLLIPISASVHPLPLPSMTPRGACRPALRASSFYPPQPPQPPLSFPPFFPSFLFFGHPSSSPSLRPSTLCRADPCFHLARAA